MSDTGTRLPGCLFSHLTCAALSVSDLAVPDGMNAVPPTTPPWTWNADPNRSAAARGMVPLLMLPETPGLSLADRERTRLSEYLVWFLRSAGRRTVTVDARDRRNLGMEPEP